MAEILEISDRVTVMRDGKNVGTSDAALLDTEKIIRMMVGRDITERYPIRRVKIGDELFSAKGIYGKSTHLRNCSLTLKEGEVLGIAGLEGSGRTELLETIFGLKRAAKGRLILKGKEIKNNSAGEAKANGFALLTEERRSTGIFPGLSIRENLTAASLRAHRGIALLSEKKLKSSTEKGVRALKIKTPSQMTKIKNLSGGNQQKVIFARWLLTSPKVLLLDEPTRGIDVGAKYEIYTIINGLAAEGKGVIMVSSEMPELIGMCDRIAVMSGGRVAGELKKEEATQEKIMELATKYI